MRRHLRLAAVLAFAIALLSLSLGTQHRLLAQDYGGSGGMGASVLSFNPQTLTVAPGSSASAKVTVKLASGKTWGTNLDASALPSGLTVAFDPASGDPTFTSTMSVKVTSSVAPGTYSLKVRATGDDPSPIVPYKVTVQKSGY